jgi:hypothetical protein
MTRALSRRPDITLDERGLPWLVTVAIHQAWQLASIADEVPVGSFQAGTPGEGNELPEPADPDNRRRHSSDREPPAISPLRPTESPARRVNMVESARRRYTTNRYLTASAGRWTMTRSWTFV